MENACTPRRVSTTVTPAHTEQNTAFGVPAQSPPEAYGLPQDSPGPTAFNLPAQKKSPEQIKMAELNDTPGPLEPPPQYPATGYPLAYTASPQAYQTEVHSLWKMESFLVCIKETCKEIRYLIIGNV